MNKLLVICGPTATGKTKLGIYLADKFGGEVLSADSRQIYKCMDIGTGKDLPENSEKKRSNIKWARRFIEYYLVNGVAVWGYDLASPNETFSVSHYISVGRSILKEIRDKGKLPIIVGGTGLYISGLINGVQTSGIPRNELLREKLSTYDVPNLFEMLSQIDPIKAGRLNFSDKRNPRRLVRAIEIAQYKGKQIKPPMLDNYVVLRIGLTAPRDYLNTIIEKRVDKRLAAGFETEFGNLLKFGISLNSQAMDTLGYSQWCDYFLAFKGKQEAHQTVKEKAISKWKIDEKKYAKRQITWFKRDPEIQWYDVTKLNFQKNIEKCVSKWYSKSEDTT